MSKLFIFIWVILAFIVMAFLEKTIEDPNAWAKKSCGWKYKISKRMSITEYHFFFWIFLAMLFLLPIFINEFSWSLFGFLLSACMIGLIVEDFAYFIVNPYFGLKKFNPKDACWYPWLKIGKLEIPISYITWIVIAVLSWYFLWR